MVLVMNERIDETRKSENEPMGKPLFTLWSEDGFYWVNKEDGLRYPISIDGVVLKQEDGSLVKRWEFDLEEIVWLMNNSDLEFDFEIQTHDKDKDICACEVTSINDLGKKYYYYKREFLEKLCKSTEYSSSWTGVSYKFLVKGLQLSKAIGNRALSLSDLKIEYINNSGDRCKPIIYRNAHSIDVEFENGYIGNYTKSHLKKGEFLGIHIGGKEGFSFSLKGRYMRIVRYSNKHGYSTDYLRETSEEWKSSYNVFKKWISMDSVACACFDKGEPFDIDTDLLSQGTKRYGEGTAICLPSSINSTMKPMKCYDYPRRVYFDKRRDNKYYNKVSCIGYNACLYGSNEYEKLSSDAKNYYSSLGKSFYDKYPNKSVEPSNYGVIAYIWEKGHLLYVEYVKELCQDYLNRGLLTQDRADLVIAYHESRTILD